MTMNLPEIITELMPPEQDVELERYVTHRLDEFRQVLEDNPVKDRTSSICNSDAFWLYWLAHDISPTAIIESGTYHGFSLGLLHAAARNAQIFSFDPARNPEHKFSRHFGHYRSDMGEHLQMLGRMCDGKRALAFFDDHKSHETRLHQAQLIGVQHVVFHDNYLTPYHSHLPIRFVNLVELADLCFEFPPLLEHHDLMFAGGKRRWLTYIRLLGGEG